MRIQKWNSTNLGAIDRHNSRSSNGESISAPNSDPDRLNSNIHWDNKSKAYTQTEWASYNKENPLHKRVKNEIEKRYTSTRKIRKNSVRAIEYLFTSDNLKMSEIFNNEKAYKSWLKDNKDFLTEIYGEENILSMHLHFDEETPHVHAYVIPITDDGRLCSKDFINNRDSLRKQQTLYASKMEKYGMIRGKENSNARHQKPNTFNQSKNYEHNRNY